MLQLVMTLISTPQLKFAKTDWELNQKFKLMKDDSKLSKIHPHLNVH